jgi:putative oxidoreductase
MSDISVDAAKPLVPALARVTEALTPYAEPLVRVATGLLLVPHGAQKLFGWFGGYGIAGTQQFFASRSTCPTASSGPRAVTNTRCCGASWRLIGREI